MSSELAARGSHRLLRALVGALLAGALLLTALAPAASAAGPRPLSPKQGKAFSVGAFLTFKVRDHSAAARKYGIFMVVANRKRVKHGQLQRGKSDAPGDFAKMKRRKHGIYTYTPERYTFPSWYMQRPDVYYWQAHHIDCGSSASNCYVVGAIRHFRVR